MRHYLFLLFTASFHFLSQGLWANPNSDDDHPVSQSNPALSSTLEKSGEPHAWADAVVGVKRRRLDGTDKSLDQQFKELNSPPTMSYVEKDGKKQWTNALSALHHLIRVEIMEWLQDDPRGQLSLMHVSHGFRRLALVMPGREDARGNTRNDLKKQLLSVLIAGQTGDLDLFIKDNHLKAIQTLNLQDLQEEFASRYFNGTLSQVTRHGQYYRSNSSGDKIVRGTLELDRRNLRFIPLNFPEASTITTLNLSENLLKVVPDLSHLINLKRLFLCMNRLRVVPDLSNLMNLEVLGISSNQLTSVPELSNLTNLVTLGLSSNKLTSVPDLSNLTNLKFLNLSGNQLTSLPDLSNLTSLRSLDLARNRLTTVSGLSNLTSLLELILTDNYLTTIPGLSHLKELRKLELCANRLTVPQDLSGLVHLSTLLVDAPLYDDALQKTLETLNQRRIAEGYDRPVGLYVHQNTFRDEA